MKHKTILFIFFLLSNPLSNYAQQLSYDFFYKYKIQNSKSNSNSFKTGFAILQVRNANSYFADELVIARDELSNKKISAQQRVNELRGLTQPTFRYEIFKDLNNSSVILREKLVDDFIGYEESLFSPESWNILTDTSTIAALPCQKATINFGGRTWIAWFSSKVAINDGPYKFSGLPGLIVKLESQDKEYSFELFQIKKNDTNLPHIAYTKTTKKRFVELRDVSTEAKLNKLSNMGINTDNFKKDGQSQSKADLLNEIKKESANRNHIEL